MSVICKMRCKGIDTYAGHYNGKPVVAGNVKMEVVYSDDPECDSKKFWDATPMGNFELSINNPDALKQFTPLKEYYVRIEEIPQ